MSQVLLTQHQKPVLIIGKILYKNYTINAVISNCCNNYGPYQFPEKLIPKMITNIFNNKDFQFMQKVRIPENGYM